MERTTIETSRAPSAIGPYSQAVAAGPFVFVSGQLGIDPQTGSLISPDFETQARQVLENLKNILESAGCGMKDVVSVDVYLSNLSNFYKFNEIYQEYLQDNRPARAVVEVSGLPKYASIEIKCVACRG